MLPPTTEPLPRVHRLFASDRLQGGARRPKAAMPPSPLSTTHPHSLPPIPTLHHRRHITRCTTRGLTGLCAVYVRPEGESSS